MGELIAQLVLRYGEAAVLSWLVGKLNGDQDSPHNATAQLYGHCPCKECAAARFGLQLDPDDGCYYWELPTKEQ